MIKPFLSIVFLLSLLLLLLFGHYTSYDYDSKKESLQTLLLLSSNTSLSLSVGYDKSRDIYSLRNSTIYPELESTSSLEFVYAK